MENLSKENFWNDLQAKYPDAMAHFSEWIDQYKKEVSWDELFGNVFPTCKKVKFHDIPFDMQNGIIARYELELYNNGHGNGKEIYQNLAKEYRGNISKIFFDLQTQIQKKKDAEAIRSKPLDELGFVFIGTDNRFYWCRMHEGSPWFLYKHPDGMWVTYTQVNQSEIWQAHTQKVHESFAQKLHDSDPAQVYNSLKQKLSENVKAEENNQ